MSADREARAERIFRALLRVFPRHVHDDALFEPQMVETFHLARRRRLERTGRIGVAFWMGIVGDLASASWRERRSPLDPRGRPPVGSRGPHGGGDGMTGWIDDLGHAGRRLLRSPGFALTALTILTLGIGVTSTAFSVVNALLLQPPPFDDPERVVLVLQDDDQGNANSTSFPAYFDIARTPGVFESVSAFTGGGTGFLDTDGSLASIGIEYSTSSYLDVIGLATSRGRWFGIEHDDPDGPPAAVVTHRMWTDALGSDPDALGRTLRINGGAVTVVGVGPPEFNGGRGVAAIDVWLSLSSMRATSGPLSSYDRRQDHPLVVRARLAPGVSLEQASQAMDRLAGQLATDYPELNEGRGMSVLSVLDTRVSPADDAAMVPAAWLTMGVVLMVLVIGTLNLANLLLVRSTARAREIAVRLALGSSRARVVRVVLTEALLLAGLGGVAGLGVAVAVARMVRNSRFDFALPLLIDLRLDARVVGFTVAVSLLAGLVFGLLPALRSTRRHVTASLRDDAAGAIGRPRRITLTGGLVGAQVAVSLLLLAVAGVFIESLARAQAAHPGIDFEDLAYIEVNASPLELGPEATLLLFERIEERLEALPGISGVTSSLRLPGAQFGTTTLLLGSGLGGVDRPREVAWNYVAIDYFELLDIPLLHGRYFRLEDFESDGARPTIVSAAFARTYWGRTDIVGESYRFEGSPEESHPIVGVVADAAVRGLGEAPTPSLHWPLSFSSQRLNLVLEAANPESLTDAIRAGTDIVRETDARIMVLSTSTMADHLGETLERQRLAGGLLASLGAAALLLALLGVYGVVSFSVSRRRREVGIRMALGAGGDSVVRLFVRDVAAVVGVGALVGGLLALPASRYVGVAFTGAPGSPSTTVGVALLLLATSLAATMVPAVRATRTDPTEALRQQ